MKDVEIEKFITERKKLHEAPDLRTMQDLDLFEKIAKTEFAKTRSSMLVDRIRLLKTTTKYKGEGPKKGEKRKILKNSSMYSNKIEYLSNLLRECRIYKKRLERILN
jgi:hypothetical protein